MTSRLAFSLIELLTVVAIVAVLAGMLLPALSVVKRAAKSQECAGNMHQLAMAISTYTADWNGLFRCYNYNYGVSEDPWTVLLYYQGYVEADSIKILSCPAWGGRYVNPALTHWLGYGFRTNTASSNNGLCFTIPSPKSWSASFEQDFRIDRSPKASSYGLITDTCGTDPADSTSFGLQFYSWSISSNCNGISSCMMHFRHSAKANVMFADGHVEGVNSAQVVNLITTEYANPTLNIWGADANGKGINLN